MGIYDGKNNSASESVEQFIYFILFLSNQQSKTQIYSIKLIFNWQKKQILTLWSNIGP